MLPLQAQPSTPPVTGSEQPAEREADDRAGDGGGADALWMDLGVLAITAVLVTGIVLLRRWLALRSRRPHPALPRERLLPLSHHDTLHDPKYLGRILEDDDPPLGS